MSSVLKRRILLTAVLLLSAVFAVPSVLAVPVPADALPETDATAAFEATRLSSNAYTQPDDESVAAAFLDVPGTFALAAEDAALELWAEPFGHAIRVVDKRSGWIFGSSFAAAGEDLPYFNHKFEGIVNSAVVIEYYVYDAETGVYTALEESMFDSELTTATHEPMAGGFATTIRFGLSDIGLTLAVTLEDGDLHLRIANDSIVEGDVCRLKSVRVYPYFGAVYGDSVPGYLLVPDGSGALVRYRPIDAVTDVYQFNYYGTDAGVKNDVEGEAELTLPVFGMVQGIRQHGFLGIIESGATDATLVVSPARSNLRYYLTHPLFTYRAQYASPTSRAAAAAGQGTQVIQTERNAFDIHLVYRFLDGEAADYVGMANSYRDRLLAAGVLHPQAPAAGTIPTHVEIVGGERTEGFLFDRTEVLTGFADAQRIIAALGADLGVLDIVFKGALQGGFSGAGPATDALDPALGTRAEFIALVAAAEAAGHAFSLYADPLTLYSGAPYNPYRDVARRVNGNLLGGDGRTMALFFAEPLRAMTMLEDNVGRWDRLGVDGVALGTIGGFLYSTHDGDTRDRAEVAALYRDALAALDVRIALYRPNAYLLGVTDAYLIVPTVADRYRIETDTVPFVAIALAGTMPLYGPYLNFAADANRALLACADAGIYPSYVVTEASAFLLQDTELGALYSSSFATWRDRIVADHVRLDAILAPAIGAAVVSRRVLEPGFVRIDYANGVRVYVNYGAEAATDGGVTVAAGDARTVIPDA